MLLLPIHCLISLGTCYQHYQNKEHHYLMHAKQSNESQHLHINQDLLHMSYPSFFSQIISRINSITSGVIQITLLYHHISSNKRPHRLLNLETVRCDTH